jgi:hypothetical protein
VTAAVLPYHVDAASSGALSALLSFSPVSLQTQSVCEVLPRSTTAPKFTAPFAAAHFGADFTTCTSASCTPAPPPTHVHASLASSSSSLQPGLSAANVDGSMSIGCEGVAVGGCSVVVRARSQLHPDMCCQPRALLWLAFLKPHAVFQVQVAGISAFSPSRVVASAKRCASMTCDTSGPTFLAWPPLQVVAGSNILITGMQCSSAYLVSVAEFQWVLPPVWSAGQRISTSFLGAVLPTGVRIVPADHGVQGAQYVRTLEQQALFSSCAAAAASAAFSCAEVEWDPVPGALAYVVAILPVSNQSKTATLPSILVRSSFVALNFPLFNLSKSAPSQPPTLSASLPPLFSITAFSHNATSSPLFVSLTPQFPNTTRISADWSLLLLSFETPLQCDVHVYVPRPHLAPQRIATLQSETRLFMLRLKGRDGLQPPCANAGACGTFRLQLSICMSLSSASPVESAASERRAAALPWLPPFAADVAINITRDVLLAGGVALYLNADALVGFDGEGGVGGDERGRCEIPSAVVVVESSGGGSGSSSSSSSSSISSSNFFGESRSRLFVSSTSSSSATLCIPLPRPCNASFTCTASIAAAVSPHAQHAPADSLAVELPSAAALHTHPDIRAHWRVRFVCLCT